MRRSIGLAESNAMHSAADTALPFVLVGLNYLGWQQIQIYARARASVASHPSYTHWRGCRSGAFVAHLQVHHRCFWRLLRRTYQASFLIVRSRKLRKG